MNEFEGVKWLHDGNGEVCTEGYDSNGEHCIDHICNCEVVNGVSIAGQLVSAAPEMLQACIRLRNQLYAAGYESKEKSLNPTEDLLYQTEQAINKALGK